MNSQKDIDYYLLQAVELGTEPKFTISYENTKILKETEYNFYTSTEFDEWVDDIKYAYNKYETTIDDINGNITNHTVVGENLYYVSYDTGIDVIYNYNIYQVEYENTTIDGLSFWIKG